MKSNKLQRGFSRTQTLISRVDAQAKPIPKLVCGFSLIELMVSVAIFSIVMTIGIGALLTVVDANKKAQALKSVMNNLNFALENMSRNIRVGIDYNCSASATPPANIGIPNDCPSGGILLAFEGTGGDPNDDNDQIVYRLNGTQLERSTDGGAQFISITAAEVTITNFNFYVTGTSFFDNQQPRVVITIRGVAGASQRVQTNFNIQATISQRLIDQ